MKEEALQPVLHCVPVNKKRCLFPQICLFIGCYSAQELTSVLEVIKAYHDSALKSFYSTNYEEFKNTFTMNMTEILYLLYITHFVFV